MRRGNVKKKSLKFHLKLLRIHRERFLNMWRAGVGMVRTSNQTKRSEGVKKKCRPLLGTIKKASIFFRNYETTS